MRLRRLTILSLFLTLLLPTISAQAAGGVTVGPAVKEVVLAADEPETSFEITLTNRGSETITARLRSVNFKALNESGGLAFVGTSADTFTDNYGLTSWLGFSKDVVTLEPGKAEKVKALITNRASLSPGGHYGAIVAEPINLDAVNANNQVEIVPATATLVLLKKTGGERYDLELKETATGGGLFSLPDKAEVRFQNIGNVHVVPRGTVIVKDPAGRAVSKAIINTESGIILPETFRKYPSQFTRLARAWLPGRYVIETQWRYDGQDEFVTTNASFWYVGSAGYLFLLMSGVIVGFLWIKRQKSPKNTSKLAKNNIA